MSAGVYPQFRTKTGTCTITPDEIVLTRTGRSRLLAKWLIGSGSVQRALWLYGVIALGLLGFAARDLVQEEYGAAAVPLLVAAYLVIAISRSLNNTAIPQIPRRQIRMVTATRPCPPVTRGYFTVSFLDGTREVQRLILLPGVLEDGQAEFERALEAFRAAGLKVV